MNNHENKQSGFTAWVKQTLIKIKVKCNDFYHLAKENHKVTVAILVFAVLIVAGSILAGFIYRNQVAKKQDSVSSNAADSVSSNDTGAIPVPEDPLEQDAYPEVNALIAQYYQALADGDLDTINKIKNYTEETEQIKIQKKSEYIDNYSNIVCYTKKGPVQDSYLVYAYYEVKFKNIGTAAPGLNTLYVCKNDQGQYYINDDNLDENVTNYLKAISAQDDVVDLFNKVQVQYNDATTTDEALGTFLAELPDKLKTAVGEALAALEATTEEAQTTEEATTEAAEATVEAEATVVTTVQATDVVNIRSSDSETADKVGKAQIGDKYTLLETKGNGWSKIDYNGTEAFIKTEFLEEVSTESVAADDTAAVATDDSNTTATTDTVAAAPGDKLTVKTTVNVRASASETGEKLGVCYKGEQLEVKMVQADGWTKVIYSGKTGYVKSEFLE